MTDAVDTDQEDAGSDKMTPKQVQEGVAGCLVLLLFGVAVYYCYSFLTHNPDPDSKALVTARHAAKEDEVGDSTINTWIARAGIVAELQESDFRARVYHVDGNGKQGGAFLVLLVRHGDEDWKKLIVARARSHTPTRSEVIQFAESLADRSKWSFEWSALRLR